MRLLLIRHGQTPANVAGILETTIPGPGLTALGQQQAQAVPHALRAETVDGVYASRMVRTQLTSRPLADALGSSPATVLDGLHEIEAGELEGRSDPAAVRAYVETAWAWGSGDLDPRMPGGPDGHEFFRRYDAGIAAIAATHPDGTGVAFSHGAAIRVWAARRAVNLPEDRSRFGALDNTAVVILNGDPAAGWELESWGGQPVGGTALHDPAAEDVTGESIAQLE